MKIIIGTDVFYPFLEGGGEVHTYKVAKHLVEVGHKVTVITGKSSQFENDSIESLAQLPDEEVVDGIKIKRLGKPYKFGSTVSSLPALYEMYKLIREEVRQDNVDVVNFVLYRPCLPCFFAAFNNVPTVLTAHLLSDGHGDWNGWLDYDGGIVGGVAQKVVEEFVLRLPYNRVMTVSSTIRKELQAYYSNKELETVYNGVDIGQYENINIENEDTNKIIFIGALKKRKGVLDAIEIVKKSRQISGRDLHLEIVSGGGNLEKEIRQKEDSLGFISLHKKASDEKKIKLLKQASLLVFPSAKESFGLVTIEALASGTPFVAYDIPALQEVNGMTNGGLLVDYGDVDAFAESVCELLNDPERRNELAMIGKQNVVDEFTWEAVAKREERVFEQVVEEWS